MSILSLWLVAIITSWDSTCLAIALPVITSQLRGTTLESFWANISFILGVTIVQPIYVSTSNVLGRKQPLYASFALFTAGSIAFAVAENMGTLIAGRLIQGLGAGGLDVLEEIILTDITSLKERPRYLAVIASAIALGSISGPFIGASFSEFVGWRWIGWINLPVVGVSFLLALFFLRLRSIDMTFKAKIRQLDWIGMLLFTIGAPAVALPLSWADTLYPWASWQTLVPLLTGCLVLLVFGIYEKKSKPAEAMMPYSKFTNSTSIICLATSFLHGLLLYTTLSYLPLFFQAVFLETPLEAAKSILPCCCLSVAFSFIAPMVIEFTRRYRVLLWLGWMATTLFLGLWLLINQSTSWAEVYIFQSILGVGLGTVFTATQVPMQASVSDVNDTGTVVGMLVVFRIFGALVGLSASSAAFNAVFQKSIDALGALPEEVKILDNASQAISFIPVLRELNTTVEVMNGVLRAYEEPFQAIWIMMTCASGIGFLVSIFIKEYTLERDDIGRQGLQSS
ncbi:MFS general substrate transporter [Hypoxylon rubiginosum]|uniref:MFS general substrate transporter n=1 Tax=Hypoxylon rubiginosum TaxID=110542 RepID=A0ACC0DAG0_9PEZI|nr:MFS general substrate transporter [Hypoxylon rubiginosum]